MRFVGRVGLNRRLRGATAVVLLGAGGCVAVFQRPAISVAEIRLTSMSLVRGTLAVTLDVENPNRYALESRGFRYDISFADGSGEDRRWISLAGGEVSEVVKIPARDTGRVEVRIPFDLASVGSALGRLLRQGELDYRFTGELEAGTPLGGRRIPFDLRGLFRP